ncbi:DHA2 family efflux MFS transporter permease subunit [Cellulomonas sp. zg-ZUI222]|uniref:DHA2 family efflux MFS transporter permease subunit n=1 Tax=Cellulomonas wangleii TaxID=2816956 RepID=A0ABX8DAX6_9CELL|nr:MULTISPECIES: DHA2 family efflux MFS transporter permease subunit [Cellulomonas]MBO0901620.1 DHA2 family efflux MFS transporter permease subunit [Cellulomonas sp. zg-ZUI22]MBO0922261.1 DHA2 family efflux MFS transporter permease subunit [Cellulomonas wangleii]MBO0925956.1 DHA2 family efflux MFS transporter permease subunit [Cellulomonas wangleii]QVI63257.1 DHA2 family efflux MFS transporter permease subunit [Cellulomonas wangleii]
MTSSAPGVDLHGRSPWSVLPPLCLGFFMIMVDTTIVNIAVPTLQDVFDADLVTVGWVNSAYLLTFAVLLLVTGRLGDRFGPRPVFVAGLVVFTAASLACGLAGSVEVLIAARAVQGVGGALMTPQTMAMITRVFPPQKRGAALGVWGSVAGVATITGPVLGGVIVETIGWEWIFYVNIPVGVVALWLSLTRLPALPTHARTFDVPGVVLSVVGLSLLVFGLQEGPSYGWGTIVGPVTVPLVVGAGALVSAAFLLWQRHRGDDALLPLRLFAHRNFSLANVAGAAVSFAMTGIFFPFTLYLQQVLGLSPLHAALVGLPGSLISGVVAPFAGRLSDRVAGKWVVATGFSVLAVSIGILATQVQPDVEVWRLVVPMLGFGVGTGLVFSPLGNLATTGLDQRTAGAGAGAFNTNRQVGGVIGSAVVVALLTSRLAVTMPAAARDAAAGLPAELRTPFVDGFRQAAAAGLGSAGGGFDLPAGVPAEVAEQLRAAAQSAAGAGFAAAAGQTLGFTVLVLLLGAACAFAMRGGRPQHAAPAPDRDVSAAVG